MRFMQMFIFSYSLLVFRVRFARSNSICPSYSGHRISAQTNDVYHHTAPCVLHSLGVWRRNNPHADLASDQVSGMFNKGYHYKTQLHYFISGVADLVKSTTAGLYINFPWGEVDLHSQGETVCPLLDLSPTELTFPRVLEISE